jgi:hypothetical protein
MSYQVRRALERLSDSIDQNLHHVEEKLCKAGVSRQAPLVYSVAKYYSALDKLADK